MNQSPSSFSQSEMLSAWSVLKSQMTRLWTVLHAHGYQRPPPTDKNFNRFLEMSQAQREVTLDFTSKQIEIYVQAEELEIEFENSADLLRVALQIMGLRVDERIFGMIDDKDVIELYGIEHVQLFRSFNFFQICNYSLDDVLMYEWFNLYERCDTVTQQLLGEAFAHLKSGETISPFRTGKHVMRERFSEQQGVFEIQLKYISSAFRGPEVRDGYLVWQKVKVLDLVDRDRVKILGSGNLTSFSNS